MKLGDGATGKDPLSWGRVFGGELMGSGMVNGIRGESEGDGGGVRGPRKSAQPGALDTQSLDSCHSRGPGGKVPGQVVGGGGILTQDGQHHVVSEHLKRARADIVVRLQGVPTAQQVLARSAERGLDVQGEGPQAAPARCSKQRQLQDLPIQVHSNVSSQLVWEVTQ